MPVFNYSDDKSSSNAPRSSVLFSRIQKDILTGDLRPGVILTELRIFDLYKVSSTPV